MTRVIELSSDVSPFGIRIDGDTVKVPDTKLLFTGKYSRSENDLKITGEDGNSILIKGYFDLHNAPALVAPNGAQFKTCGGRTLHRRLPLRRRALKTRPALSSRQQTAPSIVARSFFQYIFKHSLQLSRSALSHASRISRY